MAKPCAVFWDIQNVGIPKGQSADSIIKLIRSTIIKPNNLTENFFFGVCDVNSLQSNVGQSFANLGVDIMQVYNSNKDSADVKMMGLMRRYVQFIGQDCSIILICGDTDYYGTLSELKKNQNITIHLIRLAGYCSSKLSQISDSMFMLHNGVLESIKTHGPPLYFISIKNYPLTATIDLVMTDLNGLTIGSINNSSILYGDIICIGFPSLWSAEKATQQLNGSRYHGHFLKAELIKDSPLDYILKNINDEGDRRPKTSEFELKKLTFIRITNSCDSVCTIKFIKFCIACTTPNTDSYILSRKSFFWLVFIYESHAQECLKKLQILYPDAVISEPPSDLNLPCLDNPYTVQLCDKQIIESNTSKPFVPIGMAQCPLNDPTSSCDQVVNFLNNPSKMEVKAQNNVAQEIQKYQSSLEVEQIKASNSGVTITFGSFEDSIDEGVEPCKPEIVSKDSPLESVTKDDPREPDTKDVPPESEIKPKSKRLVILRGKHRKTYNHFNPVEMLNCL